MTTITAPDNPYWPDQDWRRSTPSEQGIDAGYLVRLFQYVERRRINLNSLLIVRNGYMVTEAYFEPHSASSLHDLASATKSVVAMLVGVALQQGLLRNTSQRLGEFFPELRQDRKSLITLAQVLSMTMGLRWREGGVAYNSSANTFTQMTRSKDWIEFILRRPVAASAGAHFAYNSGAWHLLSALLQRLSGETSAEYARKNLFEPLGITASVWPSDPTGITLGSSWLRLTAPAMARLGYLYLQRGRWQEQQIVPDNYVRDSTRLVARQADQVMRLRWLPRRLLPHGSGSVPPMPSDLQDYGWGWWLPAFGGFAARGYGGQSIYVLPAASLVVVMTAGLPKAEPFLPEWLMRTMILPAVKRPSALPAKPQHIRELNLMLRRYAQTRPSAAPLAPPLARKVSGLTFIMGQNAAGVRSARLTFHAAEAALVLQVRNVTYATRLGLDGAFRRNKLPDGTILALRGEWENDRTFTIESRSTRTGDIFVMHFTFEHYRLVMQTSSVVEGHRTRLTGTAHNAVSA